MSLFARNVLIALGVTLLIMGTVWYAVSYLNRQRVEALSELETQLSTNTLSLETQLSLLENAPCSAVEETNGLSSELSDLGDRLSFLEVRLGSDNSQVLELKKQYTIIEIRDYLLTQKLSKACKQNPVTVLYFYSDAANCPDCDRAGYALSYLHTTYPTLRVYSFDYDLDLGALQTLIGLSKVKDNLPAFIIDGKVSYGFDSADALKGLLPVKLLQMASTTATTTSKK